MLFVRRFAPGDYSLFGWLYVRWVLLETLLGRWSRKHDQSVQWHSFRAKSSTKAWARGLVISAVLVGSPIGGEFDLKTIGSGASLNHQSKVFRPLHQAPFAHLPAHEGGRRSDRPGLCHRRSWAQRVARRARGG